VEQRNSALEAIVKIYRQCLLVVTAFLLCVALLPAAWAATGGGNVETPHASAAPVFPEGVRKDTCLGCHSKADLRPVTERGSGLKIHVPEKAFGRSVHGKMGCVVCHAPKAKAGDFKDIPHRLDRGALPSCMNCHDKTFDHIRRQLGKSRHFEKLGAKVTCTDCHDPHTQQRVTALDSYAGSVEDSNKACVDCHTSAIRYKELTGRAVYTQNLSHEFLPYRDRHFAGVRCVECHTPVGGGESRVHQILPKEKALRDCKACHTEKDSFFVKRVAHYTDVQQGGGAYVGKGFFDDAELIVKMRKADITLDGNGPIVTRIVPEEEVVLAFGSAYVPGLGQTAALDGKANLFLICVLAALLVHGLLRVVLGGRADGDKDMPGEMVYPLTVRVLHWVNAVLFLVLLATGLSIHYSGAALSLPMEFSVEVHDAAGVLLVAHFAAFLLYSLLTGEIRQYVPFRRGMMQRFGQQVGYYLAGIFSGAGKPHHVTAGERMNPVQQLTYLLVYCLGMFVLLGSGLLLLIPELAAKVTPGASARTLATAHFVLAMGYLAFLMLHVYMTTTGKRVFSLIKGMITGRHYE